MIAETARRLSDDQAVVGWFQGRLEWGPRSLGSPQHPRRCAQPGELEAGEPERSNSGRASGRSRPPVIAEKTSEWFDIDRESPYMLLVCQVQEGKRIPAVTHVDGSARGCRRSRGKATRISTTCCRRSTNERVARIDQHLVQCPRGEPIVCTPEDAYLCFMRTQMDVLVLGNQILLKEDQPELVEDFDWRERYELD